MNLTQGINYPIIARLSHYPKQLLFHLVTETPFTGHIKSFNSLFDMFNLTELIPQIIITSWPHAHATTVNTGCLKGHNFNRVSQKTRDLFLCSGKGSSISIDIINIIKL